MPLFELDFRNVLLPKFIGESNRLKVTSDLLRMTCRALFRALSAPVHMPVLDMTLVVKMLVHRHTQGTKHRVLQSFSGILEIYYKYTITTRKDTSRPQPDLEYILKYGSSDWLSGHLRAGEIGNTSCGGAIRHRYTAISF